MNLFAEQAISSSVWMWIVGGALSLIVTLVGVLGGLVLYSMRKINDNLSTTRLDIAENMITWKKFTPVKQEMERDRHLDIELAITKHTSEYKHEKVSA